MTPNQTFSIQSILVLLTFIFLFALAACDSGGKSFRFKGTLNAGDTGQVYLAYDTMTTPGDFIPEPFDSVILKSGSFEFKGTVPYPIRCFAYTSNGDAVATFILENSEIALDTGTNQFGRMVKGSKSQVEADEVESMLVTRSNENYDALDSLAALPNISEKMKDSLKVEARKTDSLRDIVFNQKVLEYVRGHSSSYGALYGWEVGDLWAEGSTAPARRIFEQFDPTLRNSPWGKYLEKQLRYYESMQAGQPAPELNLKDKDGTLVNLSSYKGKRVVIFAQANWTNPNPQEIELLNKLTNTVIIANDPDETWSKAKCVTVNPVDGLESSYRPSIGSAPWVFIIDENGRILSKDDKAWRSLK